MWESAAAERNGDRLPRLRTVGEKPLSCYGSVIFSNHLGRTRMPGGVGAGGEKLPATRLGHPFSSNVNL